MLYLFKFGCEISVKSLKSYCAAGFQTVKMNSIKDHKRLFKKSSDIIGKTAVVKVFLSLIGVDWLRLSGMRLSIHNLMYFCASIEDFYFV